MARSRVLPTQAPIELASLITIVAASSTLAILAAAFLARTKVMIVRPTCAISRSHWRMWSASRPGRVHRHDHR